MIPQTALRPAGPDDEEFLFALYASTREEELSLVPWSPEEKRQFLRMQFHAQTAHYKSHSPAASFDVIVAGDERAGRLIVDRRPGEIHIVDIALMPEFRGRGIGSSYLKELAGEAHGRGVPLRIFVEFDNPAQRLYERLGFVCVAEHGAHRHMELSPPAGESIFASAKP
jgi:ribosomal protein S18 acetylase RimI-like enzyme